MKYFGDFAVNSDCILMFSCQIVKLYLVFGDIWKK